MKTWLIPEYSAYVSAMNDPSPHHVNHLLSCLSNGTPFYWIGLLSVQIKPTLEELLRVQIL